MIRSSVFPALSLCLLASAGYGTSPIVISWVDAAASVASLKPVGSVSRTLRDDAPSLVTIVHDTALPLASGILLPDAQTARIIGHPKSSISKIGSKKFSQAGHLAA